MTWGELDLACRGYEIRLARSRELERFIAAVLINTNRGRGTAAINPEDILPLITDKKRVIDTMTKEEFEEIQRDIAKRYGREEINS